MKDGRLTTIGARPYRDPGVRELCHAIKDGDTEAIRQAAAILSTHVPDGAILVPVPNREGKADYTLLLAEAIKDHCAPERSVHVVDALTGHPHPSLCLLKEAGLPTDGVDFGFRYRNRREKLFLASFNGSTGNPVYLVDNVVDTGRTARAAARALRLPEVGLLAIGNTYASGSPLKGTAVYHRNDWSWGRKTLINLSEGYASVTVSIDRDYMLTAWISDLQVHPDRRREGLGNDLLTEALLEARRMGATMACLWPDPSGSWLTDWYKRHGFEEDRKGEDGKTILVFDLERLSEKLSEGIL